MVRLALVSGRLCTHCGEIKQPADFHRQARMRDGLSSWCRSCAVTRTQEWRAANRDAINARRRSRYLASGKSEGLALPAPDATLLAVSANLGPR